MCRILRPTLAVTLVMWCLASAVAVAAVTTVLGTVQDVDIAAGRLTLRSTEGILLALPVHAELLASLRTGDAVEVKRAGPNAIIIRKQVRVQQSAMDGALLRP